MFKKLFKNGIALTLAATLVLAPTISAQAAEKSLLPVNPLTTENPYQFTPFQVPANISTAKLDQYHTQSSDVKTLEDVQALASQKATILTSMYGVTSVQYALIENGEIILSGQSGYFNKDTQTTPNKNSMYGIGSVSKMFTTAAVMNLVEDGKVELDKPVTTYIPDFTMADERYTDITVRMLLNHSSGLMGSTLSNAILLGDNDMTTYKNILKILSKQRLKANPGAFSVYCNDGFTLAELLVERVSGKSFSNYISSTITTPLNMLDTNTPADTFDQEKLAKVYHPGISNTLPADSLNMIGAGGIYSSTSDLCKFATIFMKNSSGLLNSTSISAMENKEYLRGLWSAEEDSILAYGLGWDSVNTFPFNQYGIKALSKGGDSLRYHANLTVLPDQNMAIAVLTSGGSSSFNQIMAQEILLAKLKLNGTIPAIKDDKVIVAPAKVAITNDQKEYAGFYSYYGSVINVKIADDGTLSMYDALSDSNQPQTFSYGGNGKYYQSVAGSSSYISFEKKNGKTYLYTSMYASLPGIGQTAISIYQAQKVEANTISKKVKSIWEKRAKKNYFIVSEKYSSQMYLDGLQKAQFPLIKGLEGYVGNDAIVDSNHAVSNIEIPGNYGRDLRDFTFEQKDGIEYCYSNGYVFASEEIVKNLSTKSKFTCLIGKDGYAKYYKITSKSASKVVSVKVPNNAAFMVYNKDGVYVNNSYVSGKKTIKLPKDGYVVLAGDAGSKFTITYK